MLPQFEATCLILHLLQSARRHDPRLSAKSSRRAWMQAPLSEEPTFSTRPSTLAKRIPTCCQCPHGGRHLSIWQAQAIKSTESRFFEAETKSEEEAWQKGQRSCQRQEGRKEPPPGPSAISPHTFPKTSWGLFLFLFLFLLKPQRQKEGQDGRGDKPGKAVRLRHVFKIKFQRRVIIK